MATVAGFSRLIPVRAITYELIGMMFIFVSIGWQIFIERPVTSANAMDQAYVQEHKIDTIWMVLLDAFTHQYEGRSEGLSSSVNIKALNDGWEDSATVKPSLEAAQANIATAVKGFMFLIGSCFVLYAKWLERAEIVNKIR